MKISFGLTLLAMALHEPIFAQNVGIGTANPLEKLDVAGAIKIAGTTNPTPAAGTIRWNETKNDFEGFNGKAWVSLTGGKSGWGNQVDYSYETSGDHPTVYDDAHAGSSLALQYPFLIATSPNNPSSSAYGVGAIRIFKHVGNAWAETYFLIPTLPGSTNFGSSVALHNNKIAVGAQGLERNGNSDQGSVLVYDLTSTGVPQNMQQLFAGDGNAQDLFGRSVAIHNNRILVGAPGNDIGSIENQGAAYVFENISGTWQQTARLLHSNASKNDVMGKAVALHGNWAAVSSADATINNQFGHGKLVLFQYNGSAWVQQAALTSPVGSTGHSFYGAALHLTNDTLLVGMPQRNQAGNVIGNGKVFMYLRSGNTWNLHATLTASDEQWGDGFGSSIHLNGDYLIIGSAYANVGGSTLQGKAYVYKKEGGAFVQQAILTSSAANDHDYFGTAAVICPQAAIVGAPYADAWGNEDVGRIFFFKH